MAEYINIKGQNVEVVASDPANPTLGQIWYNSTSNTLKGLSVSTVGAWATGTNLPVSRAENMGVGTRDAFLFAGGQGQSGSYLYDGSTWTTTPSLNVAKGDTGGAGTSTDALNAQGGPLTAAELWDGVGWTNLPSMTISRFGGLITGSTSTAALLVGGGPSPGPVTSDTTTWDGISWTSVATLPFGRYYGGGFGTQTATTTSGGNVAGPNGYQNSTENWNGTSWSNGTSYPQSLFHQSEGAGTQTVGLMYGGTHTPGVNTLMALTNFYDGATWTATASMPTGKAGMSYGTGGSTQTSAAAVGGFTATATTNSTFEFYGPGSPTTKTITSS